MKLVIGDKNAGAAPGLSSATAGRAARATVLPAVRRRIGAARRATRVIAEFGPTP
ncbi:hypothetical protein ACVBGC_11050 [Burkholderia stagnalis]